MYAALDDPNFGDPYSNNNPSKKVQNKKTTSNKVMTKPQNKIQNKKITPNYNNNNNNKNQNFKGNNNYAYINKKLYEDFDDDNDDDNYNEDKYYVKKDYNNNSDEDNNNNEDFEDNINYDKNIIKDPLSMFSSPKYKYEDNDDQNIIPGNDDIKSQIDIPQIESIITSLNDQNHKYKKIEELQSVLKDLSIKHNLNTEESQAFLTYCWLCKKRL